jgi:hexosaminidase
MLPTIALTTALHLIPRPAHVEPLPCSGPASGVPLTVGAGFDEAARRELDERWRALGIGTLRTVAGNREAIVVRTDPSLAAQAYRLTVTGGSVLIRSSDAAGAFYAAMTLAQLPVRTAGGWRLPCVRIEDRPALQWRILSDDVSRGPLPTMRYFKERIRTIAAFKMNGYSPYMENTFVSPTDPLPAPLDGITPAQMHALAIYAARFHVALIPQQQTFAHMHNTLRVERYARAGALPHGFLLAPNSRISQAYLSRIISQELQAVPHPPFFHIGSDETQTLGLGRTKTYVERVGLARAYADHVIAMKRLIAPSGARVMLWDDVVERYPMIMRLIPHSCVIVNWHYADLPTFEPYIRRIANGGFEQMVDPGAGNWNEIFPKIATTIAVERRFIDEAKAAGVLGLYESDWHDDGETLYEATWYPVLYAGAAAWQRGGSSPQSFAADFPSAFFGVDDPRYSRDVTALGEILAKLESASKYDTSDVLFWDDPFDAVVSARMAKADLRSIRLEAESVEQDLFFAHPPLHAGAAAVMFLAARRYDVLARKFQIAAEVRSMYRQAVADESQAGKRPEVVRDLFWCKYWMWELRDAYEGLARLYAQAWRRESRAGHLASNLERYHMAAQRAIGLADAFHRALYDGYLRSGKLPPFASVVAP